MKLAILKMLAAAEVVLQHTAGSSALTEEHNDLEEAYGALKTAYDAEVLEEHLWQEMINHYGGVNQMNAFTEEIGEVLQAMNKVRRDESAETRDHFTEELIDVECLLQQMKLLVKPEALEIWKRIKIERIRHRLAKSKLRQAQDVQKAITGAGSLQNLFNALHTHGIIATQDEMLYIMEAMKKDLSLAEQEEFMDAPEGEDFNLVHDGQNFVPAENIIEVNDAEDINPNSYQAQNGAYGIE
jgi:NTP pyrophosphatase (non-canonical NTP hydrolase)